MATPVSWRQRSGSRLRGDVAFRSGSAHAIRAAVEEGTPAAPCAELGARAAQKSPGVRVKVYPDARHSYDLNRRPATFGTHHMEYNGAATRDSRDEVQRFFAQYLK